MKKRNAFFCTALTAVLLSCSQAPQDKGQQVITQSADTAKSGQGPVSGPDSFVPKGYSILHKAGGDLNLDSISDVILVLKKDGEDSLSTPEHPLKRNLLILLGHADRSYTLAAQNENAVYYDGYDPNFKDAFVDLSIMPGRFSIDHYGGFAQRWGRTTTFEYSVADKTWYLCQDAYSTFEANDEGHTEKEKVLTSKDFGRISFRTFDIYKRQLK